MPVMKYKDSNGNWIPISGGGGGDTTPLQEEIDIINSKLDNTYNFKGVYETGNSIGIDFTNIDTSPNDWFILKKQMSKEDIEEYGSQYLLWDSPVVPCSTELVEGTTDEYILRFSDEYKELLEIVDDCSSMDFVYIYNQMEDGTYSETMSSEGGLWGVDKTNNTIEMININSETAITPSVLVVFPYLEMNIPYYNDILLKTKFGWESYSTGYCYKSDLEDYAKKSEVEEKSRIYVSNETYTYWMFDPDSHNTIVRFKRPLETLELWLVNGSYDYDYISEASFDSGETPTSIVYADSGALNWVGTDCSVVDGHSVFAPSPNTHYDIIFYFNGTQIVGLVNGFTPAVVEGSY